MENSDNSVSDGDLTSKIVRGVGWSAVSRFSAQGMQFVVTAILAHLLFPKDFGIIGMATIFIGFIGTVNELGFSTAIVQRKNLEESHLYTSFWATLGIGVALCAISLAIAPYAAYFFNNAIIRPVMMVMAIGFVIGPLGIVHQSLLRRNLNFKKLTIIEILCALVSGTASIILALLHFGVWSLVWGGLMSEFVFIILLWKMCSWRPSLRFSPESFKELFRFGKNMLGQNIANYVGANMDYLIIGKFMGSVKLGYYTMAYNFATSPQTKFVPIITRVTFPAFSKIQEDNEKIRRGYLKLITYISLAVFPLLTGLLIVAPEFVRVIYGIKWIPIILPLRILCIAGIFYSLATTIGSILLPKGRPDIAFKLTLILRVGVLTGFILLGLRYGIVGVATAVAIYAIIATFIGQWFANRLIDLRMKYFLGSLRFATLGSGVMASVLVGFRYTLMHFLNVPDIVLLISSILLGGIIYIATLKIIKIREIDELIIVLRSLFAKRTKLANS